MPNIRTIYSRYILGKLAAYLLAGAMEQRTMLRQQHWHIICMSVGDTPGWRMCAGPRDDLAWSQFDMIWVSTYHFIQNMDLD